MKTTKTLIALAALTLSSNAFSMGPQPPKEDSLAPQRQESPEFPVSAFTASNSLDLRTMSDPNQLLGTWMQVMETCDLHDTTSVGHYRETGLRKNRLARGVHTIKFGHVPVDLLPSGAQSQYFTSIDVIESLVPGEIDIVDRSAVRSVQILEKWVRVEAKPSDYIRLRAKFRSADDCRRVSESICRPDSWSPEKVYDDLWLGSGDSNALLASGSIIPVRVKESHQRLESLYCGISASDATLLICHDQAEPWAPDYFGSRVKTIRKGCATAYRKVK